MSILTARGKTNHYRRERQSPLICRGDSPRFSMGTNPSLSPRIRKAKLLQRAFGLFAISIHWMSEPTLCRLGPGASRVGLLLPFYTDWILNAATSILDVRALDYSDAPTYAPAITHQRLRHLIDGVALSTLRSSSAHSIARCVMILQTL